MHPEGEAHSATDIIKMAEPNANENKFPYLLPGNYSIIEAGSTRFVLEVVDRKQANKLYEKFDLKKVYQNAYDAEMKKSKNHIAATIAGAKAICNLPNSGLKFYQTTDKDKRVLTQTAGKK